MTPEEKQVVSYASAAHWMCHILELAFAATLPFIRNDFPGGLFLLGLVANVAAFAFGAGALPAGAHGPGDRCRGCTVAADHGPEQGMLLLGAASLFAFFNFMGQPVYNSLIARYTPSLWQGSSFSITFFATFGLGSFSAGFAGYIADTVGTHAVFVGLAGIGLAQVLLIAYLLSRPRATTVEPARAGV